MMLKFLLLSVLCLCARGSTANNPDVDTISLYIKAVLENLKQEMPNGIPHLGVPPLEPLRLDEVQIPRIKEGVADVKLDMKDFELNGLSSFIVESANGNPQNLGVDISLHFPKLSGRAQYNLDGKVFIFPLYGNGQANVKVENFRIRIRANVAIVDLKKIQMENLNVEPSFSSVTMDLQGILGGGNLGDVVNSLLSSLGRLVFEKTKHMFLPEMNRIITSAINNELKKVDLDQIIAGILPSSSRRAAVHRRPFDEATNAYLDKVLEGVREELSKNYDPLTLPDEVVSFSEKVWFVTVYGSARLDRGSLRGLGSLHRAGDCKPSYDAETNRVTFDCHLGVDNLIGSYSAYAQFMGIGVGATANLWVSWIRVHFVVSADVAPGAVGRLDHFSIPRVSLVGVLVQGLGPLDFLLNILANSIANIVAPIIAKVVEGPMKHELGKVLKTFPIPQM